MEQELKPFIQSQERSRNVGKKTLKEAMAQSPKEGIRLRGFYKLQIENQDGSIDGDSGWCENITTNLGFQDYIVKNLGKSAGSKQIAYMELGTGGTPNATAVTLPGAIMGATKKETVSASLAASSSLELQCTFNSTDRSISYNISNIGLFDTSGAAATLFAGNTYTSSAAATNQNVNATYTLNFATA